MPRWFAPSPERTRAIIDEIRIGSEPKTSFYVLLVASAMIACFGLVSNSTAVIIGAMLVSPLMTPIFGMCLGLLRGEAEAFVRALSAEVGGVVLAVGASYLFGLLPLAGQATPEMLVRTQPQLLDLLVAVFAGFAGAYALLDERVSPALPGVAIATAIVPPLSTCGLCLALGAYEGAFGAFLLFFANFVSIQLVASILFTIAGLAPAPQWRSVGDLFRRFGLSLLVFVMIAVVLTHSLIRIIEERRTVAGIEKVLTGEFKGESIALDDFQHHRQKGTLCVLATVRSPDVVRPHRVTQIQDALQNVLGTPTALVVRTMISRDVAAIGSDVQVTHTDLNGVFFGGELAPDEAKRRVAYQVILEQLQAKPEFELLGVQYGHLPHGPLVVANVRSLRRLRRAEIGQIEAHVQTRLRDERLQLLVRSTESELWGSNGPVLVEWTEGAEVTPADRTALLKVREGIRAEVAKLSDVFPTDVHFHVKDGRVQTLVEVVGPRTVTPEEVNRVQTAVAERSERPVEVNVWYKADAVVTPHGYASFNDFTSKTFDSRIQSLPKIFNVFAER